MKIAKTILVVGLFSVAGVTYFGNSYRSLALPRVRILTEIPASPMPVSSLPFQEDHGGHAIVPGGIHSLDQLLRYYPLMRDAKLVVLDRAIFSHVTYRKNGQIYWTRFPRLLPIGTQFWLSSYGAALVACGNEIQYELPPNALTESTPPADLFPPVFEVETLQPELHLSSGAQPPVIAPKPVLPAPATAIGIPISGGAPSFGAPGTFGLTPVPEPNTFSLLALGMAVFSLRTWLSRCAR